jgi:hypothetical protein
MSLGPLPYKAKVAQANQDQSTGMLLNITVQDNGGTVRSVTQYDFSNRSFQNGADIQGLLNAMETAILQQFFIDAADLPTALDTVSVSLGG